MWKQSPQGNLVYGDSSEMAKTRGLMIFDIKSENGLIELGQFCKEIIFKTYELITEFETF